MYYDRLFQMCGYVEEEIKQQAPRIESLLAKCGLDNEDAIRHCEENTKKNFDVSLKGVRDLLKVYMMETLDYSLARDEREQIVHIIRPAGGSEAGAMGEAEREFGSDKIWARSSIQMIQLVFGCVFDIIPRLLEIGENLGQSAGRAHCSEYQIYAGCLSEGILPIPDVSISVGYFCDQSPVADAMLSEMFGYDTIEIDGSLSFQWGEWPNFDDRNIKYTAQSMQKAWEKLAEKTGFLVTPKHVGIAAQSQGKIAMAYMNLTRQMAKADPQPISQADVNLACYAYFSNPFYVDETVAAINQLTKDIRQRVKDGVGVVPKGAPRVFVVLRHITDMSPMKIIEELGLAVPFMMLDAIHPNQMLPPSFPDDPWAAVLENYYRMPVMSDSKGALEWWKWWAEEFNMDGFIHVYASMCRPWATPSIMAKKYVQEEMGDIPYLVLEGDSWDTRFYSAGSIRTRIESFAEVIKVRKIMETVQDEA